MNITQVKALTKASKKNVEFLDKMKARHDREITKAQRESMRRVVQHNIELAAAEGKNEAEALIWLSDKRIKLFRDVMAEFAKNYGIRTHVDTTKRCPPFVTPTIVHVKW